MLYTYREVLMLWQHLASRLERWLSGEPMPLDGVTKLCISVLQQHVASSGLDGDTLQHGDDVCRYAADMIAMASGVPRVNIEMPVEQLASSGVRCGTKQKRCKVVFANFMVE